MFRPARLIPLAAAAAILAGCATEPSPTTVDLTVATRADTNGGLPVQVRVYYLTSTANFQGGDFFALTDSAQATLGADLVALDSYLMMPATTQTDAKSFDRHPTHIGVVAGFRDIDRPGWQAVAALTPEAANTVSVEVGASSVTITTGQ